MWCVESLASAKFSKVLFKSLPKTWGFSGFATTFGDFYPTAEEGCKLGYPLIKVQGVWRDDHNFGLNEEAEAKKLAIKYSKLQAHFNTVKLQFSPFCEHLKNEAYMIRLFDDLKKIAPNLEFVNTPAKFAGQAGAFLSNGILNELHESGRKIAPNLRYQYSHDGLIAGNGSYDCDIEKYKCDHVTAENFWFWICYFNLRRTIKDTTPRPQRKCVPVEKDILALVAMAEQKKVVNLKTGWLYKAQGEHDTDKDIDLSANKPAVLGPKGVKVKEVILSSSTKAITLQPAGISHDGRAVFRHSKYGFEIGREFTVIADGQPVGTIDAPFRQNEYKNA